MLAKSNSLLKFRKYGIIFRKANLENNPKIRYLRKLNHVYFRRLLCTGAEIHLRNSQGSNHEPQEHQEIQGCDCRQGYS